MKKIITLLILFCSVAFAQDVNTTVSQAYKDTLTATVDTVIVRFNAKFDYYTLALQRTSSGTDTVIVQTASFGETYWTTRAIVDLSTGDYITSLYVTATGKEYIIADTDVRAIRLITMDVTAATEFILAGRKGAYIQGNITGFSTADNQTNGNQKGQIVDGSGNVIGSTGNAMDINVKSGSVAVSSLAGNGTFASGNIAITTAAQLHSNTACKKVTITNYTAGEYVFVGNASVTTANGFPLGYLDSITLTVSNLNLVYVVSDGTSCDIRFSYEN